MIQGTHLDDFLKWAETREASLMRAIERLDDGARATLSELLNRFDRSGDGHLSGVECVLVNRILRLYHRISADGLALTMQALDYLDVNENSKIDFDEVAMAVEVFEMFCRADSLNDTLSNKELKILLAVLEHAADGNEVLGAEAREALRDALWTPDEFLAEQRKVNPRLEGLL